MFQNKILHDAIQNGNLHKDLDMVNVDNVIENYTGNHE